MVFVSIKKIFSSELKKEGEDEERKLHYDRKSIKCVQCDVPFLLSKAAFSTGEREGWE